MRFGWTFIIGMYFLCLADSAYSDLLPSPGFIPVVGDVVDASLNYTLVVRKCRQAELPGWLVRKMLLNNAVSAACG
jgi:Domain of unknown function (DUF4112)